MLFATVTTSDRRGPGVWSGALTTTECVCKELVVIGSPFFVA